MVNRGIFLVRFALKEHQDQACNMNGILFDKKPFIVKPCYPNISYEKSSLISIPVWVKLPNLDVWYWTESMLRKIVGYLDNVLKMDNATLTKARMLYARVLVDMSLVDGFPKKLFFSNENDELITQRVQYDWLPSWCTKCAHFGHVIDTCRMGLSKTQLQVDEDGFGPLRKAFQPRVRTEHQQGGKKDDVGLDSSQQFGQNSSDSAVQPPDIDTRSGPAQQLDQGDLIPKVASSFDSTQQLGCSDML